MTSVVHLLRGDPARALASAEESLEISAEQRFLLYTLLSRISRGRALGELSRPEEARKEIKLGIDEARSEGVGFMRPMMESWLADMHARSGDDETALSIVEQALADVDDVLGRSWESELHRQKAQLLVKMAPERITEAVSHFETAIEVARHQSAKSLELRAATSLAGELCRQEKFDEALLVMQPIHHWFTEGLDTADLRNANLTLTNATRSSAC
jgi:predicted ATPase